MKKQEPTAARGMKSAMAVTEFCLEFGISRTAAYREIQVGRLKIKKCGRRTLVSREDAEEWLRSLPAYQPDKAV